MESSKEFKALIRECHKAKERAYCPYSNFRVGCAVLTEDGTMFTGCNVENACYGLAMCAERNAIIKAVTEGHRKFQAIAVGTDIKDKFKGPCGPCRQFLVEFGECDLYMVKPDLTYMKFPHDLLPMGFGPADLLAEKI
ncbi:cytidine deaminase-like [Saccoglossus kowalevskii]|uniref:Cytidine deaminase n=1 Tax=Saccoglossus kowalevskii TaxID=10224 RepID=A0ABM0LVA2_SACKO|nr:PREDICTED: cytidine deaminase-like [Saccoglossus kowalevskii]